MTVEGELSIHIRLDCTRVAGVKLDSSRPVEASRMLEGQGIHQALALLPVVFNICGMAQASAGARACESALGAPASPQQEQCRDQLVAVEIVREHLWRIFLDWPVFLGLPVDKAPVTNIMAIQRACTKILAPSGLPFGSEEREPVIRSRPLEQQYRWINMLLEECVYGMSPAQWLEIETPQQLVAWIKGQQTLSARYLGKVQQLGWNAAGANGIGALPALDKKQLRDAMRELEFLRLPRWDGQCRETSACTRTDSPLLQRLRSCHGNGLMTRLVARLTEVARLAQWLAWGESHQQEACKTGIGLVEAARGLLVHHVVLDGNSRISHYRILAPTEWNFHPQGVVARSLASLEGEKEVVEAQARQIIHAIDPCVGYRLVVEQGSGLADA